jgi:hypothetical protein
LFGLIKYQSESHINIQAGLRYEKSTTKVSQQADTLILGELTLDYVEAETKKMVIFGCRK